MLQKFTKATAFLAVILFSNQAFARNYIHIVGSSTLYPLTTVIAEKFGGAGKFNTPVIESNGTGGGIKLFCLGVGKKFPDFVNASRKIEESEVKKCNENGIKQLVEIKIGYDGIVLANSSNSIAYSLTKQQIFLALADMVPAGGKLVKNPYVKWSDIDKALPNKDIVVYGPPTTSGTRDAFAELVMEKVCSAMKEFKDKFVSEKDRKKACHIIRTDGKFIEAGENDNLIVQKLKGNSDAIGIFGYSFLRQNSNVIKPAKIENVSPSFENITNGKYSVSRPLFIYLKKEHLDIVPGIREFAKEIVNSEAIGQEGYLVEKGLIPMHKDEFKKVRETVLKSL